LSLRGDNGSEMNTPRPIDDATAETLFAGGSVDADLRPLARAVRAYRDVGRQPVHPAGELAVRMATGVFTSAAGSEAAPVNHINGRGPVTAAIPGWRRVRMAILTALATATAKIAGLSVAAKATAGLSIAAASIGTAGFAGVLPEPAQDRFDTVVETVAPNGAPAAPNENAEFGERVSEDARDGGVDGEEISEEARQQGELRRPEDAPVPAPGDSGVPADTPASDHAPDDTPDGAPSGTPDHPDGAPDERPEPTTAPSQP
jgi:hypothetical protein